MKKSAGMALCCAAVAAWGMAFALFGAEDAAKPESVKPQLDRVRIVSTKDGTEQNALWRQPKGAWAHPLLVSLHTWSRNFKMGNPQVVDWAEMRDWAYIAPDFRGPNKRPQACGSDYAVQDIVDAVEWAKKHAEIDEDRIYLIGGSGGGHMTLLMAGRHPEIWAAVAAACPITDLKKWHEHHAPQARRHYADMLEAACEGTPADKPGEYAHRSPMTHLHNAKSAGLKAYVCTGIHDGWKGSVPVGHSFRAFNALADERDRISDEDIAFIEKNRKVPDALKFTGRDDDYIRTVHFQRTSGNVRFTLFEGGHEGNNVAMLHWLENQKKGSKVEWNLPPLEDGISKEAAALAK